MKNFALVFALAMTFLLSCAKKKSCSDCDGPIAGGSAFNASLDRLRFVSFALRDEGPNVDDAKAVESGEKSVEEMKTSYLADAKHKNRLLRYFKDFIGIRFDLFLIPPEMSLEKSDSGVYSLKLRSCGASQVVEKGAWWLAEGESIKICSNATSDFIRTTRNGSSLECSFLGDSGLQNSECGCGPDQILCFPSELEPSLRSSLQNEIAVRGLYSYENNLSWLDYLGGNFLYGNRLLWYYYLRTSAALTTQDVSPQSALGTLRSLSLTENQKTDFPSAKSSRAGVVTAPGFLKQYNNFRSRVRSLSQNLLCQDISPFLNTDNVSEFFNTSLTAADISHASKSGCSGCHFGMDNHGSALLGWEAEGFLEFWKNPMPSQKGHAFGVTGEGPQFLVQGYVERAPTFNRCMAQRAFESFTGDKFDSLSETEKDSLIAESKKGPRSLLNSIFSSNRL